ncbi:MAG TPA: sigma-54 dependent transcriptional regulator [Thermoanaerobaculia bacterium]|nr:sigma-54 dependent transcriptional regulator [Thermoanaerobaculia bacterium]
MDDDSGVLELIRYALESEPVDVETFSNASLFLESADPEEYELILCDMVMPGMTGLDLLREVRKKTAAPHVVIMTGQGTIPTAVRAMKDGAADFLMKPFKVDELLALVRSLVHAGSEPEGAEKESEREFAAGRSEAWLKLLAKARRVAELPTTVLIRGETGTGKDVLARYIASFGPRASKPFVALNCAAMPEHLIESELFGHVKGAYSGADTARRGLFEEAAGGTLFLDEIGAMPLPAQAKVLRALEDRKVRKVGENKAVAVDVRILAATNLDLESAAARQEFRPDLYFRLSVVTLVIPPLRERPEDIPVLTERFLASFQEAGAPKKTLSPEALALLSRYPFPGNVRELKHAIEQAMVFSTSDRLVPDDFELLAARADMLPERQAQPADAADVTPERLKEALSKTRGNRVEAAKLLGVSRSTLYRLLRQHGVPE